MSSFTITPDPPFSLEAAGSFGFGPHTGRPEPDHAVMRMAFVTDDLRHQVAVRLHQDARGDIHAQVHGAAPPAGKDIEAQVRRILSLDQPAAPWLAVGVRDPVIGGLQAAFPGLRPVLFHSPYEAAAWSVLALRRHRSQAAAIRNRLALAHGATFDIDGHQVAAFPLPAHLLEITGFQGLDATRVGRLHAVAQAALAGRLDPARLRAMDAGDALRDIQALPGFGPAYAQLVLLRSTGATDLMTYREPRLPYYAAHFYRAPRAPLTPGELADLSAGWRPFRTWASVLLRVAGDRAHLPVPAPGQATRAADAQARPPFIHNDSGASPGPHPLVEA
jgi:DNA-3-methyladenine glycosylase II